MGIVLPAGDAVALGIYDGRLALMFPPKLSSHGRVSARLM
jgi:hypothetical protein